MKQSVAFQFLHDLKTEFINAFNSDLRANQHDAIRPKAFKLLLDLSAKYNRDANDANAGAPPLLKYFLESCLSYKPEQRPSFHRIIEIIDREYPQFAQAETSQNM